MDFLIRRFFGQAIGGGCGEGMMLSYRVYDPNGLLLEDVPDDMLPKTS